MKFKCILCGKDVDLDAKDGYGACPHCGTYAYFDENGVLSGFGTEPPSQKVGDGVSDDGLSEHSEQGACFENVSPIPEEETENSVTKKKTAFRTFLIAVCILSLLVSASAISSTLAMLHTENTNREKLQNATRLISLGKLDRAYSILLGMNNCDEAEALLSRFSYVPKNTIKGKVTFNREYNSLGLVTLEKEITSNVIHTTEYFYDENGKLKEKLYSSYNGAHPERTLYYYDGNDELSSAVTYKNDVVISYESYLYENGKLLSYTTVSIYESGTSNEIIEKYTYDEDGNLIKHDTFSKNRISQSITYTYKNGLVTKVKTEKMSYYSGGNQKTTSELTKYEYDEHGKVTIEEDNNYRAEYVYNADGRIAYVNYIAKNKLVSDYILTYRYTEVGLTDIIKSYEGAQDETAVESYRSYILIFDYFSK